MKTEDLILALSADTLPQQSVRWRLARALPTALAVTLAALVLLWGLRPDLWAALVSAAALKTGFTLGLGLTAGALAIALAHPGMGHGLRAAGLGLLVALAGAGLAAALARDGVAALGAALSTPSLLVCLLSIPVLALPFLGAVFWALAAGAALRPRLTGAAGGLMAGSAAASVYSLYCDQDAALFVLPAYGAAIGIITLAGALAGPRMLKW